MSQEPLTPGDRHFGKFDRNLIYLLVTVAKQLEADMPTLLEGTRLNPTTYRILGSCAIYGAVSISDLGRIMLIDRAQISRTAAQLEQDGLVRFAEHPHNKRKKMVTLTDAGRAELDHAAPRVTERREGLEAMLGKERLADLLDALNTISDVLPR
ncbi:MarR family winged helix-turn-helix transcriptional regulator [Pseudaestuariivita sp.]|uniref:MarR family winged helix-turn-helix transcriptional regulator n=1 Tax=Pseudaestuariivita sp. TaxID=2211669 RepID=UPI0040585928